MSGKLNLGLVGYSADENTDRVTTIELRLVGCNEDRNPQNVTDFINEFMEYLRQRNK